MELQADMSVGRQSRAGLCGRNGQRGYGLVGLGVVGGNVARERLSGEQLAMHQPESDQGAVRGSLF